MTRLLSRTLLHLVRVSAILTFSLPVHAATISSTGPLNTARDLHTATLLPNGKVLVAGGRDGSVLASAELYDPVAGTWMFTGSLSNARRNHTATLLPDGKVLVAGGFNGSIRLTSAELYDPSTGTWTTTGSLADARQSHSATLLPSGLVLVAGGGNGAIRLAGAELYNPGTGIWTATGPLATARNVHTATLMPDGKVLVAGGSGSSSVLDSSELYDPGAGTWSSTGGLAKERFLHTATLLPDGRVFVAGGFDGTNGLASAELYDPGGGTWSTTTNPLTTQRSSHTGSLLPDGQVLVAGGYNGSSAIASVELYDPAAGTWSAPFTLTDARNNHSAATMANGSILLAGGVGTSGRLASVEIVEPATTGTGGAAAESAPFALDTRNFTDSSDHTVHTDKRVYIPADSVPGSLRQAIANAAPGATVDFDAGLAGGTTTLGGTELIIAKDLTIDGTALVSPITVSANDASRVFHIDSLSTVAIRGLVIADGFDLGSGGGGGVLVSGVGGADLTLTGCTITGNHSDFGGGVANYGTLVVSDTTFSNNVAEIRGGGLRNAGDLTIRTSTFTGNHAISRGGAIHTWSYPALIENTTISGNTTGTGSGAGIRSERSGGALTLRHVTIAGNTANTVANNFAGAGVSILAPATLTLENSIIANNFTGPGGASDVFGDIATLGANLVEAHSGTVLSGTVIDDHFDDGTVTGWVSQGNSRAFSAHNISETGTILSSEVVATQTNSHRGIVSTSSINPDFGTAGFSMRFEVTSVAATPGENGYFIGIVADDSVFFRDASTSNFGLTFFGIDARTGSGGGFGINFGDNNGSNASDFIIANSDSQGDVQLASFLDGFTASVTADPAGWSYSIDGLNAAAGAAVTFSDSGSWASAGTDFASLFGGDHSWFAIASLQQVAASAHTVSYDQIILRNPDPSAGPAPLTGDPNLAPLADYGGPSETMALRVGSPAINAAGVTSLTTDQRGFARTVGGLPDIGAYESGNVAGYAAWAAEMIAAGLDASFGGDAEDDDSPNGNEYALGTGVLISDPGSPNNPTMLTNGSGEVEITFGFNAAAAVDTKWIIKRSTDLVNFTEIYSYDGPTGSSNPGAGVSAVVSASSITVTDGNPPEPRAFYKFVAEQVAP